MTRVFLFSLPLIEVHKIVEKFVKTFHTLAGVVLGILLVAMPAGADLAAAESQLHMVLACENSKGIIDWIQSHAEIVRFNR